MAAFAVRWGRRSSKSFADVQELTFERVQFGNLLLNGVQLLGHQALQPRPHRCATFPLEPACQVSELREGQS
jgi:hypothetical protein